MIAMKKLLLSSSLLLACLVSSAQCSTVSVQVSSSDTSLVQLYQAGFFLIDSGYANVVAWQVSDMAGNIVHQDTTSGMFNDQSFSLFNHSVPLTDSMRVIIEITNGVTGEICFIEDTLYWEEVEVLPGSFIGSWSVLNSTGGTVIVTDVAAITGTIDRITLYPSIVDAFFQLRGDRPFYSLRMINANGQLLNTFRSVGQQEPVYVTDLDAGAYFIQVLDERERLISIERIVKR